MQVPAAAPQRAKKQNAYIPYLVLGSLGSLGGPLTRPSQSLFLPTGPLEPSSLPFCSENFL